MRAVPSLLAACALVVAAIATAQAAEEPAGFWTTPTVRSYGKIDYLPNAAYQPRPDQT